MIFVGHFDFEFAVAIVTARTAADELGVVLGPVLLPIIPEGRMNEDEAFAGINESENGFADVGIGEGFVVGEVQDIDVGGLGRDGIGLRGVFDGGEAVFLEGGLIGLMKEFLEVVRTAATDDEGADGIWITIKIKIRIRRG